MEISTKQTHVITLKMDDDELEAWNTLLTWLHEILAGPYPIGNFDVFLNRVAWCFQSITRFATTVQDTNGTIIAKKDVSVLLKQLQTLANGKAIQCPLACPHGDMCSLPRGHDGGHNHRGCNCNEPDQPLCDRCGERSKPVETITGSGTSFYICADCRRAGA